MPFKPKNERHAIHEVVFVLTFDHPFTADQIEIFSSNHDRWKADLPRKQRNPYFQVSVVEGVAREAAAAVTSGVMFDAVKRDGSLDWRLRVEDDWIGVNCLSYTRWEEVWPRARTLLLEASETLGIAENPLTKVTLEYIDIFEWEGDLAGYEVAQLLRKSECVPSTLLRHTDPLWHLHLGWFERESLPADGRLLNRIHLDAIQQEKTYLVKIDNVLRVDMERPVAGPDIIFEGETPFVDLVFEDLHIRNKSTLSSFITKELADRIGLNAGDRH
jgi:uncharacterized protein (TIGR04255 family)